MFKLSLVTLAKAVVLYSGVAAMDMNDYLKETKQLIRDEKYEESLKRLIWLHDHALEITPEMYGVRLSSALADWNDLGKIYPPALDALKNRRNEKENQLFGMSDSFTLFHDVALMNEALGEINRTATLFQYLDEYNRSLAERCWNIAREPVINAGFYELAKKYVTNLSIEYSKLKAEYEFNLSHLKAFKLLRNSAEKDIEFDNGNDIYQEAALAFREEFVDGTLLLIEMAKAIGKEDVANTIRIDALSVVDSEDLRKR